MALPRIKTNKLDSTSHFPITVNSNYCFKCFRALLKVVDQLS